ncbi:MAG: peptidylprolyl isomerase [Acidobacteria bacterium]|nr:peptidylprolyl isomerase [Acidobacteriota bacterium]
MLATLQKKDFKVRLFIGFFLGMIALAMVISLGVGPAGSASATRDAIATVDGQEITMLEVQKQLSRRGAGRNIPPQLESYYLQEIAESLIFSHALEYEARRMGLSVTDEEQAERIKRILPTVFSGNAFVGREKYEQEVISRAGMTVPEFEEEVRKALLQEKVTRLVADGIRVTPQELREEFNKKNDKVKIEYVAIKPADLEPKINPSEAELAAFFEKNKARYPIAEKRSVRYALLDLAKLRASVTPAETELRGYYTANLGRYTVQNRAHVSDILFKTIGKSDAEIEEVRRKATDVLQQARKGAKFEELAKKYSDDSSKDKGGDLDWIVQGQTVAEFEKAAFSLPKGTISDLVKTEFGFYIIKIIDRENARTQPFEEVRDSIVKLLSATKAEDRLRELTDKLAEAVRKSNRAPIADIAKQFSLTVQETGLLGPSDPVGELGPSRELHDEILRLKKDELSQPFHLDRGVAIFSVKDIEPAHPGTLAEAHARILGDYRREKSVELAKTRADELAARTKSGEDLSKAAKALGLDVKTSEAFARAGSIPDVGSARQLPAAFTLPVGSTGPATQLNSNWVIFRVAAHDSIPSEEFEKQKKDIENEVLRTKITQAYEEFRNELQTKLYQQGVITVTQDNFRRLTKNDWLPRK